MKIKDTYTFYKRKYSKYVILIRVGNFYEAYGEEAYILNNIFGYKIVNHSSMTRAGFPFNAYKKVTDRLDDKKINYIVVENDNFIEKKYIFNNYNKYTSSISKFSERIDKVKKKLDMLPQNSESDKILSKIEELV